MRARPQTCGASGPPVVESSLWWRANNVMAANLTSGRGNKGGRPVAMQAANWLSGVLGCPACGARMHQQRPDPG